jgi:hypothetical protein
MQDDPHPATAGVEAAVRASYDAQRESMVAGDSHTLGAQLAHGFTLTHMTGYVQFRREWLEQVDSGEMTYHSMEDVAVNVEETDTGAPVLTARTRTDATIWGRRGVWPLQLEIHFTHDGSRWVASHTVASTW